MAYEIGQTSVGKNFPDEVIDEMNRDQKAHVEFNDGTYIIVANTGPTEFEVAAERIAALKSNLSDTDYVVIKMYEAALTHPDSVQALLNEYADVLADRKAWREEINALEAVE